MAIQSLKPIRHVFSTNGEAPESVLLPIGSATPVQGDLMVRTDNVGAVCGADPTYISFIAETTYTGVIPGDTTSILAAKVRPSDVFVASFWNSSAASATLPDATIDDPLKYGIATAAVGGVTCWVIDSSDLINQRVAIVKRLDAATDTYPQCLIQFTATNCTFV